jgi:two-component system phosphate regulon sensor histidine kinase PhoR
MLRSRLLWRLYGAYALVILLTAVVIGVLISRQVRQDTLAAIPTTQTAQAERLVEERLARARRAVYAGAGASAALALLLGLGVTRAVTRPIVAMTRRAEALPTGVAGDGLPSERQDEIGRLADALERTDARLSDRLARLERERTELAAILGSMVEGVVALDADEQIVHLNEAAIRLLKLPADTTRGDRIWEVVRSQPVLTALRRVAGGEGALHPGRAGVELDGRFLELHTAPTHGGGAVLVVHDLTELKRLEAVRRDFVANVSHELKTPVTAIVGLVETVLADEAMPAETRRRFLARTAEQARRLSDLVTDLLALSRLEGQSGQVAQERVDLAAVAHAALAVQRPAAEARSLKLEDELTADVIVTGDPEALRQAVDNLLSNAIRYTPEGGRVRLALLRDDRRAVLAVQDTGIGIERQHLQRIFERFYRVDSARSRELGGTGLGLSIVKHVARTHGGEVEVESAPGVGSTFRIWLPLAEAVTPLTPRRHHAEERTS